MKKTIQNTIKGTTVGRDSFCGAINRSIYHRLPCSFDDQLVASWTIYTNPWLVVFLVIVLTGTDPEKHYFCYFKNNKTLITKSESFKKTFYGEKRTKLLHI